MKNSIHAYWKLSLVNTKDLQVNIAKGKDISIDPNAIVRDKTIEMDKQQEVDIKTIQRETQEASISL
ncbi:MAG: hypothetical protein HOI53_07590 [Francisellaceae bacterium]|jgi:hypothetical protein|nr:hypothetical protein [Francisellaceae bacterium]MBT6538517.1 hypothetical protein [Francisellaceae bacterium]